MQGLPAKVRQGSLSIGREQSAFGSKSRPIGWIAHDWMADRGQMDPNLMGSAGFEPASEQARDRLGWLPGPGAPPDPLAAVWQPGAARIPLQGLPVSDSLSAPLPHCHMVAGMGRSVDRTVDGALGPLRRPPDEGQIAAFEPVPVAAVAGELRRQAPMRPIVLRHHHEAACVLVEPVHDARPALAADTGKARTAMGDQRVDQRTGLVSRGRVDHHVGRLIDNDDVIVLVDNLERDRFRGGLGRLRRRHVEHDGIAGIDAMARIADRAAADRDRAGLDQRLEPAARQFGDMRRQHAVKPHSGVIRRGNNRSRRHGERHA